MEGKKQRDSNKKRRSGGQADRKKVQPRGHKIYTGISYNKPQKPFKHLAADFQGEKVRPLKLAYIYTMRHKFSNFHLIFKMQIVMKMK